MTYRPGQTLRARSGRLLRVVGDGARGLVVETMDREHRFVVGETVRHLLEVAS